MAERRYSRYKREDVWLALVNSPDALHVRLDYTTRYGNCVSLTRTDTGEQLNAVVLARSSDWYHYSLNAYEHECTAIVAGTHDSCVSVPVLAIDSQRWYEPLRMRTGLGQLQPTTDANGKPVVDRFEITRRTQYGHNMLIGALLCKRKDAVARLQTLPASTRLRIEAKVKRLNRRRSGHPLVVWTK